MKMSEEPSLFELSLVEESIKNCMLFLYLLQGVKHQNVTVFYCTSKLLYSSTSIIIRVRVFVQAIFHGVMIVHYKKSFNRKFKVDNVKGVLFFLLKLWCSAGAGCLCVAC